MALLVAAIVTACGGGGGGTDAGGRLLPSGGLDPSFGNGGKVVLPDTASSDALAAVAVDAGGNAYLAGTVRTSAGFAHFLVVKLDNAGNPVNGFGTAGRAVIEIDGGGYEGASALVLDDAGNIYVAGSTTPRTTIGPARFAVAKLDANGNLVPGFGTGGKTVVGIVDGNNEYPTALARDKGGNLYLAGYTRTLDGIGAAFAAVKLDGSGNLVQSFGTGGKRIIEFEGGNAYAQAAGLDNSGNLYVAGVSRTAPGFLVTKLDGNGNLVASFGIGGRSVVLPCNDTSGASAVAVDQGDNVYLAGACQTAGSPVSTAALVKLEANGSPANGFGDGGKKFNVFGVEGFSGANALVLDRTGNIYVAGYAADPSATIRPCYNFAAAKLDLRGSPVASFGNKGTTTVDIGNRSYDIANSVALDGDGHFYVAGITTPVCGLIFAPVTPFVVVRLGQ